MNLRLLSFGSSQQHSFPLQNFEESYIRAVQTRERAPWVSCYQPKGDKGRREKAQVRSRQPALLTRSPETEGDTANSRLGCLHFCSLGLASWCLLFSITRCQAQYVNKVTFSFPSVLLTELMGPGESLRQSKTNWKAKRGPQMPPSAKFWDTPLVPIKL